MIDPIKDENRDEVLFELRRIKDELAAAHGYDMKRMFADIQRRQETGGRRVTRAPHRALADHGDSTPTG